MTEVEKTVRFRIDDREVQARAGDNILRAALDNDIHIPYYCWHPDLSVPASCRMCLVEIDEPDPKTGQLRRNPRLVPSCRTAVRDGIHVWTRTEKVIQNRRRVMEFYLLNHPLDCPVCDKAGECLLQDYSYHYGNALSRMVDPKTKQAKKDLGEHVLLYSDRCILCGRCVRFTREISGGSQLAVVQRADHSEIDELPGQALDDEMAGNVVDLCPVGALLNKDFLFRERVWYLKPERSVCAGCAGGCTIWSDRRDERLDRFRARFNPKVNRYWMCDVGRFLWKHVFREDRLYFYQAGDKVVRMDQLPDLLAGRLTEFVARHGRGKFGLVLSPMLDCELLFLLARFVRSVDPDAALIAGPGISAGEDKRFKSGFVLSADRTPNAAGVKLLLDHFGGNQLPFEQLPGRFTGLWITGGYLHEKIDDLIRLEEKPELLIVQDTFKSDLMARADLRLPLTIWIEREGTFINRDGLKQSFDRGVLPPMGLVQEGQWMIRLIGKKGMYAAGNIRAELAGELGSFETYEPPDVPPSMHF